MKKVCVLDNFHGVDRVARIMKKVNEESEPKAIGFDVFTEKDKAIF